MLTLPSSTLIFLARDCVDGRKGIDSLVALVRSQFGRDPLQGHLFVFLSRRGDRVRVLFWELHPDIEETREGHLQAYRL